MGINNIIFDVGNVLIVWNPQAAVERLFPEHANPALLSKQLFKSELWIDLNLGKINQEELIKLWHTNLGIPKPRLDELMLQVTESLLPVPGSFDLLARLYEKQDIKLYCLTDNTHEFIAYLQAKYDFWRMFKGIVVSAQVKMRKPSEAIYRHLLDLYQLNPDKSVFIDDHLPNILGAQSVGLNTIRFENASQCQQELQKYNITV